MTQTSLVAEQIRLQQWAEQIKDCQSRPAGMDVRTWCEQNGITKANYYYRLRRVREECLALIQDNQPRFVELPSPLPLEQVKLCSNDTPINSVAILHGANDITIEIFPTASAEFIRTLIGALADAK